MSDTPRPEPKDASGEPGAKVSLPGPSEHGRSPSNLPLRLSNLVGRAREITEVEALLKDHRLLTLTGPGGSGKTRLALAVAQDVVGDYEDGVWLVKLAPLSDPELVVQALASVFGVREQPGRPILQTLAAHLRSMRLLLLLDNCEHLVDAAASVAEALLGRCPDLSILATSREALGVEGEALFVVPPLSLPDPRRPPNAEGLPSYEAARLFFERAKAVRLGFALTEHNAMAVAQICHRLDGMPLAIELAAARVRALSAEQIAKRLEDSFALLKGGSRTATARQKTLRATMDWSHDLLSEEEKILFRRLSVFAGGFTLEAAEAVCAGGGLEEAGVLDLLSSLVDKSLVQLAERDGESRHGLLETVRQYAFERLEESGEAGPVKRRHAAYFLGLAEEAEPELKRRRQVAWLGRLEVEHDNLRAAIRFFLEEDDTESVARFACALWLFWWYHGHQREGSRYVEWVLERDATLTIELRAQAVWVRASMSYGLEDSALTMRLWERSVDLFRQTQDKFGLGMALGGTGIACMQQGDAARAEALFEEGLVLLREAGSEWGVENVLPYVGMLRLEEGDYPGATRYFEEALEIARGLDDKHTIYTSLYSLALASRALGDRERAEGLYAEGLGAAAEAGDRANAAYCLEGLAGLTAESGDPARAARLFGASEALLEEVGAPLYVHAQDRALHERAVGALRSRLDDEAFVTAWSEGRAMSLEDTFGYALEPQPSEEEAPPSPKPAGLSARETEILLLLARGMTNPQIAEELYISPRTVDAHLRSVYHKTGSSTRAEATRFALDHDLLG